VLVENGQRAQSSQPCCGVSERMPIEQNSLH
jgi:hypothetical protein